MKNPLKLQQKLVKLLAGTPALNILPPLEGGWSREEFDEVLWIVATFVNQGNDVIEENNPLRDWLDEARFYMADGR